MWRNVELVWYANRFKNRMKWSNKTMKGGLNQITILKQSVPSSSQMASSFPTQMISSTVGLITSTLEGNLKEIDSNEHLHLSQQRASQLQAASHDEYDNVLDTKIGVEEVEFAIRKLKKGHAGGHDNISPEHFTYCSPIPVLLNGTCFMQLRGGEQKLCHQKTHPCRTRYHPQTMASLHEAVRSCNLKRWISIVDSLVYKTAGKVGAYSFLFVGKRLWKLTGRQDAVNKTLEYACTLTSCFFSNPRILVTGGTTDYIS